MSLGSRILVPFVAAILFGCGNPSGPSGVSQPSPQPASTEPPSGFIFVAVEGDGAVAVMDGKTGKSVDTIDVSDLSMGQPTKMAVHNVQGAPDAKTVWATAMMVMDASDGTRMVMPDELIGIDATTFAVTKRISLGEKQHPAHVVLAGTTAYVTAYSANALLVVDTVAGKLVRSVTLPDGTMPHGMRLTPDGKTLVIAGMGTGSIVLVDVASMALSTIALPAPAIQTAVLPDGAAAFATIYRTKQVARLDLTTRALTLFDLPADSAGPVQIYPTPDSTHVWVADQGELESRPVGTHLYRLEASSGKVDLTASVGNAPHGVVVNSNATRVWTTLLDDGTVQEIDGTTGVVVATTPVGTRPNGITCTHAEGSMP